MTSKSSTYVLLLLTLVLISSCEGVCDLAGVENDGIVEESLEMLIQGHTGLNLDLTPTSPENLT